MSVVDDFFETVNFIIVENTLRINYVNFTFFYYINFRLIVV